MANDLKGAIKSALKSGWLDQNQYFVALFECRPLYLMEFLKNELYDHKCPSDDDASGT